MRRAVVVAFLVGCTLPACRRTPPETRAFPIPNDQARDPAPESRCPSGWEFVFVERDAGGNPVRVVCRRSGS
jgi:hypothetical protein